MFKDYLDYIYLSNPSYLDNSITGIGSVYTIHYQNRELPYTTSAQGKNLYQLIRKMYSELSERIGFSCYSYLDRKTFALNLECGHIFQNLSLVANYLNIGSVCSGGFAEKNFIDYLNNNSPLNFNDYMVLYEEFFGKER